MTVRGGMYKGPDGQMLHGDGSLPVTQVKTTMSDEAFVKAANRYAYWKKYLNLGKGNETFAILDGSYPVWHPWIGEGDSIESAWADARRRLEANRD